jgi:hypothetical protein
MTCGSSRSLVSTGPVESPCRLARPARSRIAVYAATWLLLRVGKVEFALLGVPPRVPRWHSLIVNDVLTRMPSS